MAELAALSLACNIFQAISFTHETYNCYKNIRDSGTSDLLAATYATELDQLFDDLGININAVQPIGPGQQELRSLAQRCLDISKKLQKDLTPGKKLGNFGNAIKARYKKSSIEKNKATLDEIQQLMQTRILGQSWIQDQAVRAEQQQNFRDLESQLQQFIRNVTDGQTQLEDVLRQETVAIRSHTTAEGSKQRQHVAQEHTATRNHTATEGSRTREHVTQEFTLQERKARWEKLLKSLEFPEMNTRRNQRSIDAYEDTLEWIFKEDEEDEDLPWNNFPSFLRSKEDHIYWISGKPGSGKSTLIKFLVNHPQTKHHLEEWSLDPLVISYFLWKSGSLMQRNIRGLLSSLIHQIISIQPNVPNRFSDLNVWGKTYIGDWSETELEQVLLRCPESSTQPICVFLDGLDEIDGKETPFDLIELIDKIWGHGKTKVCISSRPEPVFRDKYSKFSKMRLQDLTKTDIYNYAKKELEKFSLRNGTEQLTESILQQIVFGADGVFLWAYLVLGSLRVGITVYHDDWFALRKRVETAPSELNQLYQDMWKRFGDNAIYYQREASFYFSVLLDYQDAGHPNIFELAFANSTLPQAVVMEGQPIPSLDKLISQYQKCHEQAENCTAGLLEVTEDPNFKHEDLHEEMLTLNGPGWVSVRRLTGGETENNFNSIQVLSQLLSSNPYNWSGLQFIHGSAIDFLQGTQEGDAILAFYKSAPGEWIVKGFQSSIFCGLFGSTHSLGFTLFEATPIRTIDQEQWDRIFRFAEHGFYRLLRELDTLRGYKKTSCRSSLEDVAKGIIRDFIKWAAEIGYKAAIPNYVDFVQKKGFQITKEFNTFLLFSLINLNDIIDGDEQTRIWRIWDHDTVCRLVLTGADPMQSQNLWNKDPSFPFKQNVSAFEAFMLYVPIYIFHANELVDKLTLAHTMKLFLDLRPSLDKKLLYRQFVEYQRLGEFDGNSQSHSTASSKFVIAYLELTMAQLVKLNLNSLTRSCPEAEEILQYSTLDWVTCPHYHARLMLIGDGTLSYRVCTTERLSTPLIIDGETIYKGKAGLWDVVPVAASVFAGLEEVIRNGRELTKDESSTWLKSNGFCIWDGEGEPETSFPEPFHGFSQFYSQLPASSSEDSN